VLQLWPAVDEHPLEKGIAVMRGPCTITRVIALCAAVTAAAAHRLVLERARGAFFSFLVDHCSRRLPNPTYTIIY